MVRRVAAVGIAAIVLFAGCNTPNDPEDSATPSVTLQLNWLPDAQHGGFYAALEEGHFAKAGLNVSIQAGGPGTATLPKVAMGRCDFAVGNADQVLLARQQGADVVAVFAAMQNSPRCIMVHAASGITSLQQLANVTLALGDGKAFVDFLKQSVPLTNVQIVSYSGTVARFLLDENFAQQGYVFSEPIMAASQGGEPTTLMVSELGFNPYSSIIITRRELLESNPELVRKFVDAVRKGWDSYLANPQQTNQRIVEANPEMKIEFLNEAAQAIAPLCRPNGEKLGTMEAKRWETLRAQLIQLQLLPPTTQAANSAFVDLL